MDQNEEQELNEKLELQELDNQDLQDIVGGSSTNNGTPTSSVVAGVTAGVGALGVIGAGGVLWRIAERKHNALNYGIGEFSANAEKTVERA